MNHSDFIINKERNKEAIECIMSYLVRSSDWDLIELEKYFKHWRQNNTKSGSYMVIMTSRGCPFNCIFCHGLMGRQFRARSAENVFLEIKSLYHKYNIRDFDIIDDCFNLDKERAVKLCNLIIDSGLKIKLSFPSALRGDLMDEELLAQENGPFRTVASLVKCIESHIDS